MTNAEMMQIVEDAIFIGASESFYSHLILNTEKRCVFVFIHDKKADRVTDSRYFTQVTEDGIKWLATWRKRLAEERNQARLKEVRNYDEKPG